MRGADTNIMNIMMSRPGILILLGSLLGTVSPAFAQETTGDFREQASEEAWARMRPGIFQDRPIVEGAGQDVIELKAPYRAEDATVVPISIHARVPQDSNGGIRRIQVYIDKNPLPLVGIFDFTAASGRADLALRVRVDDFSYVRAIAEDASGKLYMAKSFVRATGACSAPPPKSIGDSIANMGTMKLKPVGDLRFGEPNLVQLQIKHPNITGLQPLKIGSRVRPPAHFLRQLDVAYAGTPILSAQLTFSISMDPSFRFFLVPEKTGTITVTAADTKDNHWSFSQELSPEPAGTPGH